MTDLVYRQNSTNKCLPSLEMQSTTYSIPFSYSCTSIKLFSIPNIFLACKNLSHACSTSACLKHNVTPSVPAESTGFTMTGYVSCSLAKATASSLVVIIFCLIPRIPSDFIFSCILNLFLLHSVNEKSLAYGRSNW